MATIEVEGLCGTIDTLENSVKDSIAAKFTSAMVESESADIEGCKSSIESNATDNCTSAKTALEGMKSAVDSTEFS